MPLEPDGTFANAAGGMAPFHLEGLTLVAGDRRITIDDKGTAVGCAQAPPGVGTGGPGR
jgi:hypothetical protein